MLVTTSAFIKRLVADSHEDRVMVLGYLDEKSITSSFFIAMEISYAVALREALQIAIDKASVYAAKQAGF